MTWKRPPQYELEDAEDFRLAAAVAVACGVEGPEPYHRRPNPERRFAKPIEIRRGLELTGAGPLLVASPVKDN